ncbi:MAG: alpha/beta hydrolase [Fimbriimonas sp.]
MLERRQIESPSLQAPRSVWIQRPADANPERCLIFLDAELYIERVRAPEIVARLGGEGAIPSTTFVYLSYGDHAARHVDFTCSPSFSAFLTDELMPWIEQEGKPHDEYFLGGLSLSGLAAIYAGRSYSGVLAQSPSAWWNDEWLADHCAPAGRIWLSVGNEEVQENVTHAPSGLIQRTSQLASCRRLVECLRNAGVEVHASEFDGGHDPAAWAADLEPALAWLLGRA